MSKVWTTALCTIVAIAVTAFAADEKKPADTTAKPKPHVVTGTIEKISSDCIVVKNKNGESTLAIDAKTKFGTKADPKTCADFKEGDKASVSYKEDGDKKIAVSVRVPGPKKPDAKPEEKK
jgi:hypothetical protein